MPRTAPRADSRARLLAAAAALFAARGFAGTNVDEIARRARVNKAMIYYHFKSKLGLYREILGDMYRATGERVRAVAASSRPPEEKIRAFTQALVIEAARHPHFPPMMLREIADKGTHLDVETLRLLGAIPHTFQTIVLEGHRAGAFQETDPFMVYFMVIGPLMFYLTSAPVRAQITKLGVIDLDSPAVDAFVRLIQDTAIANLSAVPSAAATRRARRTR